MNKNTGIPGSIFNARTNGANPRLLSVDTLVGNDVYNLQGDDLGGIKDLMLDVHTGQVAYAVLSFGGFFGMGERFFAVPWNALSLDATERRFILNADKEKLKNAPGFDRTSWPDMADSTWGQKIHSYYGTRHYSETLR